MTHAATKWKEEKAKLYWQFNVNKHKKEMVACMIISKNLMQINDYANKSIFFP